MSFRIDGYSRVRCALELSDKILVDLNDVSGDPARFPRGAKVRFEFGLFFNGELADASQIVQPRLRIFDTSDPDSTLAIDSNSGTVTVKGDLTQAQWDSGDPSMAHITCSFTSALTAEGVFTTPPADDPTDHWFLLTFGTGADHIASGKLKSFDAGYNPAGGTPPASGTAATIEAIDALINAKLAGVVRFKGNPIGQTIELSSAGGAWKIKLGCDDNGDVYSPTQNT